MSPTAMGACARLVIRRAAIARITGSFRNRAIGAAVSNAVAPKSGKSCATAPKHILS